MSKKTKLKEYRIHNTSGMLLYAKRATSMGDAVAAAVEDGVNLSYADLADVDLSGYNLNGACMPFASLYGANLSGASLCAANLAYAKLMSANLSSAYARWADFTQANFHKASLQSANLRNTFMVCARFSDADLTGADLEDANLRMSTILSSRLCKASLQAAEFQMSTISSSDFTGANLVCAVFTGALLSHNRGLSEWRSNPMLILRKQPGAIRAYLPVSKSVAATMERGKTYNKQVEVYSMDCVLSVWNRTARVLVVEFKASSIVNSQFSTPGTLTVKRFTVVGEAKIGQVNR